VEQYFEEFKTTNNLWREEELAQEICRAIRMHASMDLNLFYPAFEKATGDAAHTRQMIAEDEALDALIDEIERAGPTEDAFFAKIHVLCEMFMHHVQVEEKARGVFSIARNSELDLNRLGDELTAHRHHMESAQHAN
jgi:hypothetical protein